MAPDRSLGSRRGRVLAWLGNGLSTWNVLLVLLAGAAFGFLVLFVDFPSWADRNRDFAGKSAFALWAAMMCAQTALWALALAWLTPSVARLWPSSYAPEERSKVVGWRSEALRSTVTVSVIVALFAGVSVSVVHWPDYLPGHTVKLAVLTALGVAVGLTASWGIWLARAAVDRLGARRDVADEGTLAAFLAFRDDVDRFLGTLGVILGLLILSTGAQRRTVLAYDKYLRAHTPRHHPLPAPVDYGYELVLVYGFFFTMLVAVIYLPTHLSLTTLGERIRNGFFPEVSPAAPEWEDRVAKRERLGTMLEIQVGPLTQFKASAAILTPLAASLVALVLK